MNDARLLKQCLQQDLDPTMRTLAHNIVAQDQRSQQIKALNATKPGYRNFNPSSLTQSLEAMEIQLRKQNQVFPLQQSDFQNGTYRIQKPGIYVLTSDIVLSPNDNPRDRMFPSLEQRKKDYPAFPGPYVLGFFAGITIESENVVLDLAGHTIQQSPEFYLLQRFFSIIELASSPFIPKQGPSNFGPNHISGKSVVIRNGKLGLSSHHGIHGNGNQGIFIHDLSINDFEVGGISLNGAKDVLLRSLRIEHSIGTNLKVPINGRFSGAVSLWRALRDIISQQQPDYYIQSGKDRYYLSDAYTDLGELIDTVVSHVKSKGLSHPLSLPEKDFLQFGNPDGIQDCSAVYGILFNKVGVAINEFGACNPNTDNNRKSGNIVVEECLINNLLVKPLEVVALKNRSGKPQKDLSGNVIMACLLPWFSDPTRDHFNRFSEDTPFIKPSGHRDLVLLCQVLLYSYGKQSGSKMALGGADISPEVIAWVRDGYRPLKEYGEVSTIRNADIMAHVMKGAVGIRLDFVNDTLIKNTQVTNIRNVGIAGLTNDTLQGYIDGNVSDKNPSYKHGGHPKSDDTEIGYTGNQCRGISIVGAKKTELRNILVQSVSSISGSAFGIDFLRNNDQCKLDYITVRNVSAGLPSLQSSAVPYTMCFQLPNWIPRSIGVYFRYLNSQCTLTNYTSDKIVSPVFAASLVTASDSENIGVDITQQKDLNRINYEIESGGITNVKGQA